MVGCGFAKGAALGGDGAGSGRTVRPVHRYADFGFEGA